MTHTHRCPLCPSGPGPIGQTLCTNTDCNGVLRRCEDHGST
jgi:hypothetical protein